MLDCVSVDITFSGLLDWEINLFQLPGTKNYKSMIALAVV